MKIHEDRSSHRKCSKKKGALKNFGKFTGKHLCHSVFFNKFCKTFKRIYFEEHLWTAATDEDSNKSYPSMVAPPQILKYSIIMHQIIHSSDTSWLLNLLLKWLPICGNDYLAFYKEYVVQIKSWWFINYANLELSAFFNDLVIYYLSNKQVFTLIWTMLMFIEIRGKFIVQLIWRR